MVVDIDFVLFAGNNLELVDKFIVGAGLADTDEVALIANRHVVGDGIESGKTSWLRIGVSGAISGTPGTSLLRKLPRGNAENGD